MNDRSATRSSDGPSRAAKPALWLALGWLAAVGAFAQTPATATATTAATATPTSLPFDFEALEAEIGRILDEHDVPGASVALVGPGGATWSAGIGLADRGSSRAMTADTLVRLGSISKSFVSLAVLQQVEAGSLALEQPVADLLPDVAFRNRWRESEPVRLEHLLEHTTGFDDIHLNEYAHNRPEPVSLADGLAFDPSSRTSRWRPGAHMSYCNAGPPMAARAIEHRTGLPYERYVAERIFGPLGMSTATFLLPEDPSQLATGYLGDGVTPGSYWHIIMRPSGSVNASAAEMARLVRMFLGRGTLDGVRIVSPASLARMEVPRTTLAARDGLKYGYGLGNYATSQDGFTFHGHAGGVNTGVAEYAYSHELEGGFFVGINSPDREALTAIRDLLRTTLIGGREARRPPVPDGVDFAAMAGTYRLVTPRQELFRLVMRLTASVRVEATEEGLLLHRLFGDEPERLLAVSDRHFRTEDDGEATVAWVENDDGHVYLQGSQAPVRGSFRRVSTLVQWSMLVAAALCLAAFLSSVLFALIWVPRWLFRRLRGVPALRARVLPLLAVLCFFGMFVVFAATPDTIADLGGLTGWSMTLFVLSVLFPVCALLGLVTVVRQRARLRRWVYVHSLTVALSATLVALYLAVHGWIAVRLWA